MEDRFATWIEAVLPSILAINPELRERYSGSGQDHFRKVAEMALEAFGEEHLARAAFLHGIHQRDFPPALVELAGPQTLAIMRGRAMLRSLADVDPKLPSRLLGTVLPGLKDLRSAVLLVLEQLDHVDPRGAVAKWTNESYEGVPNWLPSHDLGSHEGTRFCDAHAQANFLRFVVEPTARYVEMNNESRVVSNVELLHRDISRFSTLLSLIKTCAGNGGERDEILHTFRAIFLEQQIRWEWLPLGQLDRVLTGGTSPTREAFPATGSLLILVDNDDHAFVALRKLHERFFHDWKHLRDNLGGSRRGTAQALSSMVRVPEFTKPIRVEILKKDTLARRRQRPSLNTQSPKEISARRPTFRHEHKTKAHEITVFTPDGLHRLLPQGATVLNFAYAVHNDFVALARRARVNRQFVELSHPLSDGDVVWLELAESPQLLPQDWRLQVAPATVAKIQKKYRLAMRPHLIRTGERIIRQKLATVGWQVEESDERLEAVAVRVGVRLVADRLVPPPAGNAHLSADWWYLQLALLDHSELGQDLPFRLIINAAARGQFLENVVGAALSEASVDMATLVIPHDVKSLVTRCRLCPQCRPTLTGSLLGDLADKDLILHRPGTNCYLPPTPIVVHGPPREIDFYYLKTSNRTGLASDVFRVFADEGAEVVDVSATRVGTRAGVFRVQLEHLTPETREALDQRLKKLPGVIEVKRLGNNTKAPEEMLGGPLPPRKSLRALDEGVVEPFFCGDKIIDDGYFYGMRDQKATLAKLLHNVGSSPHATSVWIRGPKKVGKSSLALSFLREIVSRDDGSAEYIEAERGETWPHFSNRFLARLTRSMDPPTIDSLADALRRRVTTAGGHLVVVIDEAVNLIMNTVKSGDIEALLRFHSQIASYTGLLLIWVGPMANVEDLPPAAKHLLQGAPPMNVPPLSEGDIESMLKCERLELPCIVRLETGLAAHVRQLTGGNPFWVAHLGRAMWELSRRRSRADLVHFDTLLLREAQRMVCSDDIPFHDRIASEHWDPNTTAFARRVLEILAKHSGTGLRASRKKTLSTAQIASEVGSVSSTLGITAILEDLLSRGTVSCEETDGGVNWRLSAPLLADHLAPPEWFSE